MIYQLNDEQKAIIKKAVEKNNHIRNFQDLKHTEFYEPLIKANNPYISPPEVNRQIAYCKCEAQNDEELAVFRKSREYGCFLSWCAQEIETYAMGLFLDQITFKDEEIGHICQLIANLARIIREKAIRHDVTGSGGPGSEREFRKVLTASRRFLGIKPEDISPEE
jgi:hypothetical protein